MCVSRAETPQLASVGVSAEIHSKFNSKRDEYPSATTNCSVLIAPRLLIDEVPVVAVLWLLFLCSVFDSS